MSLATPMTRTAVLSFDEMLGIDDPAKAPAPAPLVKPPPPKPPMFCGEPLEVNPKCRVDPYEIANILDLMACGVNMMTLSYVSGMTYPSISYQLEKYYPNELRIARALCAESLSQLAELDLTPSAEDLAQMAPHHVTLRAQRAKQRQWRAGKLSPAYSERGASGDTPTVHVHKHEHQHALANMSPADAYQKMLADTAIIDVEPSALPAPDNDPDPLDDED